MNSSDIAHEIKIKSLSLIGHRIRINCVIFPLFAQKMVASFGPMVTFRLYWMSMCHTPRLFLFASGSSTQ